jgi:hypothetical protein
VVFATVLKGSLRDFKRSSWPRLQLYTPRERLDYPYQGHRVPVVHVRTRKMSREQLSYTRGVCYCVENGKMFGVRTGWLILICFWFYNLFLKNTKIGSSPSRCVMCVVLGWNVIFKDVFSLKYNNLIFF